MRHLLPLAAILPLAMSAQNDYLGNNPVWTITSMCNTGGGGGTGYCIANDTYNYYVAGDSVISGTTYAKVMRAGSISYQWQGGPPPPPPICTGTSVYAPYLMGLVRQDGRTLRRWEGSTDELLHDFDLTVGDTLPLSFTNWNTDITVTAVDSILVGTEWRHRFALANSWSPYLIEGIGSMHGLFEPISNFFDCGYTLACFGLDTIGYFPTPGPSCALAMRIEAAGSEVQPLTVFPNPSSDELVVLLPEERTNVRLQLCDLQGRTIAATRSNSSRTSFDVGQLPGGVYVLQVGDLRQRVVVAH